MVLVYIDLSEGKLKKVAFEVASYAAETAKLLGTTAQALIIGDSSDDLSQLGKYGIAKVNAIAGNHSYDAQSFAKAIADAATQVGATVVVFSNNINGKALAPRVSIRLKAGLVSGAVALPNTTNGFTVKKNVFSGKAFANVTITTATKVVSVNPNSFNIIATDGSAEVAPIAVTVDAPKVQITATNKVTGEVPLTEAEIVVSGGRGLKGPENWGLVTDLAKLLGAATACSRPVADIHWRPHHEHVGQTGIAIAPNLYIAIGISGAIQHLAGVNRSKTIVVINKDPEAPFFKAADYGIVGDAFEVMPKIIEAVKKLKGV
jgi:electron transfer flavoprotein alpha subunit